MYHISEDPRCQKSCELIEKAFLEILEENAYDLDSISVSDISSRAAISRATFYRHFDAPIDVLKWISNREVEVAVDATPLFASNYKLYCETFFEYWYYNCKLLEILVAVKHADIFFFSLEKYLGKVSSKIFVNSTLSGEHKEYLIDIWSAIVWSILKRWVLRGKKETASELTEIAIHNLPKPR